MKYPRMFLFPVLTAKNIVRKIFGRLVKIVLVLYKKKTFWGKTVFFGFFVYFLSGFLSDSAMPYGKRNLANLSKLQLTCPKEYFSRQKNLINAPVCSFCVLTAKRVCKKFLQTCQKCNCIVHSNILRKTKFFGKLVFLSETLDVSFMP